VTAIDDHGVRFLLALRIWAYLRKSAGHAGRRHHLSHRDWSWALHSQAQEILLDAVLMLGGGHEAATWPALRGMLRTEVSEPASAAGGSTQAVPRGALLCLRDGASRRQALASAGG